MTHSDMGKIEHIAGMIFKYTSAWGWADEHNREFLEGQIKELIKQMKEIEA